MPSQTFVEQAKSRIPTWVSNELDDFTNRGLASIAADMNAHPEWRRSAQAELEYREFFGFVVDYNPRDFRLRRQHFEDADAATASIDADEAARAERKRPEFRLELTLVDANCDGCLATFRVDERNAARRPGQELCCTRCMIQRAGIVRNEAAIKARRERLQAEAISA